MSVTQVCHEAKCMHPLDTFPHTPAARCMHSFSARAMRAWGLQGLQHGIILGYPHPGLIPSAPMRMRPSDPAY